MTDMMTPPVRAIGMADRLTHLCLPSTPRVVVRRDLTTSRLSGSAGGKRAQARVFGMTPVDWILVASGVSVVTGLAYGWFEAGWLRTRVVDVPLGGLPVELDGLRLAHLSDFHLGFPSRGRVATERAVAWVVERKPDLVCITGDLVSHPRGEPDLRKVLGDLGRPYVVFGNHDVAMTKDPFSRAAELDDLREAILLRDEATDITLRGKQIQIVGVAPESYVERTANPWALADPNAGLRILLCHFPGIVQRQSSRAFDLILTGHHHAGQIAIPYPGGRLALAHPRADDLVGLWSDARLSRTRDVPAAGSLLRPARGYGARAARRFLITPEVRQSQDGRASVDLG